MQNYTTSIKLKVKSKHLAAEAKIIRIEEKKALAASRKARQFSDPACEQTVTSQLNTYNVLNHHRRGSLRDEARATQLARTFLAGKPYSSVEATVRAENRFHFRFTIAPRVASIVMKYSQRGSMMSQLKKHDAVEAIQRWASS